MKKLRFGLVIETILAVMFGAALTINADEVHQANEDTTTTANINGVIPTDDNSVPQKVPEKSEDSNDFYKDKNIWVIGDSLAVGWDGQRVVKKNYPTLINEQLHPKSLHAEFASSGSQISGNQNSAPMDLSNNVRRVIASPAYKSADVLLIELGVNDLNYSSNNLGYVQQRLQTNIKRLRQANPNVTIYGVLPLASYQTNKPSDYSIDELRSALSDVYQSFGIPVLDWKNSGVVNSPNDLGDHLIHPNQATYDKMATKISDWLLANDSSSVKEYDSHQQFVSNGWQNSEEGYRQYAKHNVLASGLTQINGKQFYFDPNTKQLVRNQVVSVNGRQIYVGKDGVVQKGNPNALYLMDKQAYTIDKAGSLKHSTKTGYLNTNQGWRWLEHGKVYTGFRFYMGTYYWFVDGVRQDSGWRHAWSYTYYTNQDGRAVSGVQNIGGKLYFFGNNGTYYLRTNQNVAYKGHKYYANSDGVLMAGSGYQNIGEGWRWYEKGKPYTGFRFYMGTYYWFENGYRINNQWRSAWNYKYYVDGVGRAVQGKAYNVNGTYYDFGNNGTFYLRGLAKNGYVNTNQGWCWLEHGKAYTGFRMYKGAYYYFLNGVRQENQWVTEWGNKYYVGSDGRSVEGKNVKIGGQTYDFGTNHTFYLRQ